MNVFAAKSLVKLCGSTPSYRILENSLNIRILEGLVCLVSGVEIEYLTETSCISHTAAEDISVLKPSCKNKIVGLRYIKGLCIKLIVKLKVRGDTVQYCSWRRR